MRGHHNRSGCRSCNTPVTASSYRSRYTSGIGMSRFSILVETTAKKAFIHMFFMCTFLHKFGVGYKPGRGSDWHAHSINVGTQSTPKHGTSTERERRELTEGRAKIHVTIFFSARVHVNETIVSFAAAVVMLLAESQYKSRGFAAS